MKPNDFSNPSTRADWLDQRYRGFAWLIQTTFLAWLTLSDAIQDWAKAVALVLIMVWGGLVLVGYYIAGSARPRPRSLEARCWDVRLLGKSDWLLALNLVAFAFLVIVYFLHSSPIGCAAECDLLKGLLKLFINH